MRKDSDSRGKRLNRNEQHPYADSKRRSRDKKQGRPFHLPPTHTPLLPHPTTHAWIRKELLTIVEQHHTQPPRAFKSTHNPHSHSNRAHYISPYYQFILKHIKTIILKTPLAPQKLHQYKPLLTRDNKHALTPSIFQCIVLCIYTSVYLCIFVSMCGCVYVPVHLCICASMCLCIYVSM